MLEGGSSEAGVNPEADGKRIFDIPAAAEYLKSLGFTGASVSSVRGLISSAQLPHIKCGKKFYVTKSALEGWLQRAEKRVR